MILRGSRGGRRRLAAALLSSSLLAAGCATVAEGPANPRDPWEPFNRQVYAFNDALDQAAIKPIAEAYRDIVPSLVRQGVTNFFGNLSDAWSTTQLVLQLKPQQALEMGMRTAVNSVFGFGGLLDWAEPMGLTKFTVEDVGQTLGYWGVPSGPYVVLPFFGPSTVRDTVGLGLDYQYATINHVWHEVRDRNAAGLVNLLNQRELLLGAGQVFEQIALDKYTLLRDAYLSRRRSQLYDGEPPDEEPGPPPFKFRQPFEPAP